MTARGERGETADSDESDEGSTIETRESPPVPLLPTAAGLVPPEHEPPPMPAELVVRYELGREIARGGMGRVVEALDVALGRTVALKEALALDAESLRRFSRETKITARLEHPAIVPVYDVGTMAGGAPFYVMRKVAGRALEQLVATAETLPQRLALIAHVIAAAHAVAHAHERGIVHRDLKPSNILCGDLGETIVIDWGLAKVIGEPDDAPTAPASIDASDPVETRAGIVFGTPGFMAPEQVRGKPVDERCDVYALGATLYHLLSRRPPHHAKTADEMMKAAALAPPTPIEQLVPGVPSELATIVDKALAHDPARRYPDARELAADLDRFLTGRLVASHRYSPRERVLRFVRMHRVAVAAIATAVIGMITIGALAVTRVIGERDRADDEARRAVAARQAAEDRAEHVVLQQARIKVTANPTEAVAMVKPLVARQWREVRSIAIAARAHGVAWSLPAPERAHTLALSRDGRHAIVGGEDGSIRTYDLADRTTRTLAAATGTPIGARFVGDDRVIAWSRRDLAVLTAGTGDRIAGLVAPGAIVDLAVAGTQVFWVDDHGAPWTFALADPRPRRVELALDEGVARISPSPDGAWLALWGREHLFLVESAAGASALEVYAGHTRDVRWSGDGAHVVALFDTGVREQATVVDIALDPAPHIIHRVRVGENEHAAIAAARLYVLGPMGVGVAARSELATSGRVQIAGDRLGVYPAWGDVVVAAGTGGLAVLTEAGDLALAVPAGRLEAVATSASAPYVVGAIAGRVVVWNLEDVLPRRLATTAPVIERFGRGARVLVVHPDRATWIELAEAPPAAGTAVAPGKLLPGWTTPASVRDVVASASGDWVCVVEDERHGAWIWGSDATTRTLGGVDLAVLAGDALVIATSDRSGRVGRVVRHDPASGRDTLLVERPSRVVHLVARGDWIAVAFADRTLWRRSIQGDPETTTVDDLPPQIALADDGTLLVPQGRALRTWRANDQVATLAELPAPAGAVAMLGASALAVTDDGIGFTVPVRSEPDSPRSPAPGTLSAPFELATHTAAAAQDAGLIVVASRGAVEIIDPLLEDAHRWTLARSPGVTYSHPQLAPDGRHVIARARVTDREKRELESRVVDSLLAWELAVPATADDTRRLLDRLTNAVIDPNSHLGWQ